jgi:hypothetical protein
MLQSINQSNKQATTQPTNQPTNQLIKQKEITMICFLKTKTDKKPNQT